jgi:hypothetical protein
MIKIKKFFQIRVPNVEKPMETQKSDYLDFESRGFLDTGNSSSPLSSGNSNPKDSILKKFLYYYNLEDHNIDGKNSKIFRKITFIGKIAPIGVFYARNPKNTLPICENASLNRKILNFLRKTKAYR